MTTPRPRGSFGIDAPWVPWMWIGFAAVYLVLIVFGAIAWGNPVWFTALLIVLMLVFLAAAGIYWYATLRGKFEVWRRLLSGRAAPARILDLGCGRGAVAIMAAQEFPAARVDGIDLWRSIDQSGNSPDAAESNARANGVTDRITFTTGDMTSLPYPDAVFDLVTASLSIHNIPAAGGRAAAIDEAWRVLAPGGSLLIVDISKVREYAARLSSLGVIGIELRDAGWRVWWSGPWMRTRILTVTKT